MKGPYASIFGSIATTQFYLYGRRHCTANGWLRASAGYDTAALDTLSAAASLTAPPSVARVSHVSVRKM